MIRRNRKVLEAGIKKAKSKKLKALAYYELGLFHDNNSREREAIPNYKQALRLGLPIVLKAKALAWLSSSLYKTNNRKAAVIKCNEAFRLSRDSNLTKFLNGLKKRISTV